jgi:hypothetical protein
MRDLQLRPLRTLSGRVVDVDGRALSGVRVFQSGNGVEPTEATTDDDGRFTLSGVAGLPTYVFAQRDDYRFTGVVVDGWAAVEVVLSHRDQAIAPLHATTDPGLSREEELALARRVLRPFVDRALEKGRRNDAFWALVSWARLDPGDALDRIDGGVIPDLTTDNRDVLRTWAAKSLLYDNMDEAAALVASIENSSRRAEATILLAVTAPAFREQARAFLEQAVLYARQEEAGARALWLECAADGLLDLGDVERARSLLAEARDVAATLPLAGTSGGPRRRVADVLARVDLRAALDLVKDTAENDYRDEVYGRIAHRVAQKQPVESERVLGMVADRWQRERWAERVGARMASADPARAEKLAALITNPYRRALALGGMADSRATSDMAQSRVWLDEAFTELGHIVSAGEARLNGPQNAAVAAALLLPVAEAVDSEFARECFWWAISYQRSAFDGDEQQALTETAALAMLLARYDLVIARQLLQPIVEVMERGVINDTSECSAVVLNAMCTIDPRWAADFVERHWSKTNSAKYWDDYSPWAVFCWIMGTRPDVRTRLFLRDYLGGQYWLPGGRDNPFHARFW